MDIRVDQEKREKKKQAQDTYFVKEYQKQLIVKT